MTDILEPPTTAADLLRPTSWEGYIGQARLKAALQVHIRSALLRKVPMDHLLLDGPPGSGKTTLAGLIAQELANSPLYVAEMPFKDYDYRNLKGFVGVLFLDEVHRGTKAQQEELLPLLEHAYLRPKGKFRMDFDWLTVVMATTEPGRLIAPLADRAILKPGFDPYTDEELGRIAAGMAEKVGLELRDDDALVYGRAAAGVPRRCSHLITACRDITVAKGRYVPAGEVLDFMRLTPDGLGPAEVSYLNILFRMDQPVGLAGLKSMLDLDEASVVNLERTLIRLNLILKSARGRELSGEGSKRAKEMFGDRR